MREKTPNFFRSRPPGARGILQITFWGGRGQKQQNFEFKHFLEKEGSARCLLQTRVVLCAGSALRRSCANAVRIGAFDPLPAKFQIFLARALRALAAFFRLRFGWTQPKQQSFEFGHSVKTQGTALCCTLAEVRNFYRGGTFWCIFDQLAGEIPMFFRSRPSGARDILQMTSIGNAIQSIQKPQTLVSKLQTLCGNVDYVLVGCFT